MVGWPCGAAASQAAMVGTTPATATTAMNPGIRYAMTSPKFRAESSPTLPLLIGFHQRNPDYMPQ